MEFPLLSLRARVLNPVSPSQVAWWPDARVVVDDAGHLVSVEAFAGQPVDEDLRPAVLTPGFVDAHVHYPQTRIVGAASGPLLDWLARSTFPEEARFADPAHAAHVAGVFLAQLAASGTTAALAYGPVFADAVDALFAAAHARGQRLIAGPVLMDRDSPHPLTVPVAPAMAGLEALVDRWHGRDDLLHVAVIPRFALSCTPEMMRRGADLARARGLRVTTHLSENPVECQVARDRFDARDYLSIYADCGLLQPGAVFAHAIHLSADEWDRFAAGGGVVAHCPDSNAFLGSGGMPLGELSARGIPWAAGTDIAAGRSFRVPRALSYAYDNGLRVGRPLTPESLLWTGTRGGALALGLGSVGQIAPGFDADLVAWDVPPWADSAEQVLAALLFDADLPRPRRTWVRGRVVWDRDRAGLWPWEPPLRPQGSAAG